MENTPLHFAERSAGIQLGPVKSKLMFILPGSTTASVRASMTSQWIQDLRPGMSVIGRTFNARTENQI